MKPDTNEYPTYYKQYVDLIDSENILEILETQLQEVENLFNSIDEEKSNFRYAEKKWSIKEVLGHLIDSERIYSCRILRVSRNDPNQLVTFDENLFIEESNYSSLKLKDILNEFILLRKSTILMLKGMKEEMYSRTGIINGQNITVRALAYIIAGHALHHCNVIKERYLI
ncbi:MAG: DinB family protein [Melioribacter sp.]|uniref:DinB family protein n=1 Tax=Rosettibacter primus TaxID=3111523 RepID=UPI00247CC792|nr:DinB family protein [Melioribacter sp.]